MFHISLQIYSRVQTNIYQCCLPAKTVTHMSFKLIFNPQCAIKF